MEAETGTVVEKREIINNVMCLLMDPDGTPLGASMYLPQNVGPQHLNQIVNKLLNNVNYPLSSITNFYFAFIIIIINYFYGYYYFCYYYDLEWLSMLSF